MKFKLVLCKWLLKSAWLPNMFATVIATAWVLLTEKPLYEQWMEGVLFIVLHATLVAASSNWIGSNRRQLPYLYTRGFSRNTLWWHHMLASMVSACFVLVPAASVTLTGFRARLQELMNNPSYPFVAQRDAAVLPAWILAYAVAFSACHYVWIRRKQPSSNGWAGAWLAGITFIAFSWFGDFSWPVLHGGWLTTYGVCLALACVTILSIASRKLHQTIELH